jgi:hypothetical protein
MPLQAISYAGFGHEIFWLIGVSLNFLTQFAHQHSQILVTTQVVLDRSRKAQGFGEV